MKSFTNGNYDYIFIDQISMVQEICYKFFIELCERSLLTSVWSSRGTEPGAARDIQEAQGAHTTQGSQRLP